MRVMLFGGYFMRFSQLGMTFGFSQNEMRCGASWANLRWSVGQKTDLPWFSCGKSSEMPVCSVSYTVEYRVVSTSWRRSPSSLRDLSLWCLFFDPHLTTHQSIKCRCPMTKKKSDRVTPGYLELGHIGSSRIPSQNCTHDRRTCS